MRAGTPLEVRRRRWQQPVSIAFLISLPIALALIGVSLGFILASDHPCWASGDKHIAAHYMMSGIFWEICQP